MKLSEIIKQIEDKQGIEKYYLHHDYYTGHIQLNIEFKNEIADEILNERHVATINYCAYWEWGKSNG